MSYMCYWVDMDYDEGYDLMMKMTDDFYKKVEEREANAKNE